MIYDIYIFSQLPAFNDNKHRIMPYIIVFIAIIVYCTVFPHFHPSTEQSSPGHLIFFLLPIGIQISVNFVLFVLTAIHCNKIKAEIHRMQASDCSDQQKKKIFIADKAMWVKNPFTLLHLIASARVLYNFSPSSFKDCLWVESKTKFRKEIFIKEVLSSVT